MGGEPLLQQTSQVEMGGEPLLQQTSQVEIGDKWYQHTSQVEMGGEPLQQTSQVEIGGEWNQQTNQVEMQIALGETEPLPGGREYGGGDAGQCLSGGAVSTNAARRACFSKETGYDEAAHDKGEVRHFSDEAAKVPASAPGVTNLPYSDFEHVFNERNELGKGASCCVYKGDLRGQAVAVKKLNTGAAESEKELLKKQFESEQELLLKITHPNICRLLAYSTDGPNALLVMELCTGGELFDK